MEFYRLWALPMAIAVLAVNAVIIGPLAGGRRNQRPRLPAAAEMGRFVAIESVTTAVAAAVTAFLSALVTQRLGSTQGGYFYVPWMIATMVSLPLMSILISMVREAVARPEKADATVRPMPLDVLAAHGGGRPSDETVFSTDVVDPFSSRLHLSTALRCCTELSPSLNSRWHWSPTGPHALLTNTMAPFLGKCNSSILYIFNEQCNADSAIISLDREAT